MLCFMKLFFLMIIRKLIASKVSAKPGKAMCRRAYLKKRREKRKKRKDERKKRKEREKRKEDSIAED